MFDVIFQFLEFSQAFRCVEPTWPGDLVPWLYLYSKATGRHR